MNPDATFPPTTPTNPKHEPLLTYDILPKANENEKAHKTNINKVKP